MNPSQRLLGRNWTFIMLVWTTMFNSLCYILSHTFALSSARPLLLKIRHHDGILDKSWLNRSYPGQPRWDRSSRPTYLQALHDGQGFNGPSRPPILPNYISGMYQSRTKLAAQFLPLFLPLPLVFLRHLGLHPISILPLAIPLILPAGSALGTRLCLEMNPSAIFSWTFHLVRSAELRLLVSHAVYLALDEVNIDSGCCFWRGLFSRAMDVMICTQWHWYSRYTSLIDCFHTKGLMQGYLGRCFRFIFPVPWSGLSFLSNLITFTQRV